MSWFGKPKEPKEPKEPRESKESKESKPEPPADANSSQQKEPFDPDKLPPREKLPRRLQNIIDKSDQDSRFFDDVIDG
jgi:fission process protein 1